MGELTDRVALVTGASRGIGAASARALAAAGARVIVTDIIDTQQIASEIGGLARRLDVTDEADWAAAMTFAKDQAGGLDILVNNAAIFFIKPAVQTTLKEWRHLFAINVDGVFLGCKHAIPLLAERAARWSGGASIINMSSAAGIKGGANHVAYASSKGAVRLMTKGLANELAAQRIRVNSIHPGFIDTPMGEQVVTDNTARTGESGAAVRQRLIASHPLGRIGEPRNIADGVAFLASDRAAFMTGSELIIDGGLTAQ
jgi:NAD(P)-dependent dehydrogenase (short-subunit alcohol dehydrogenase family)